MPPEEITRSKILGSPKEVMSEPTMFSSEKGVSLVRKMEKQLKGYQDSFMKAEQSQKLDEQQKQVTKQEPPPSGISPEEVQGVLGGDMSGLRLENGSFIPEAPETMEKVRYHRKIASEESNVMGQIQRLKIRALPGSEQLYDVLSEHIKRRANMLRKSL